MIGFVHSKETNMFPIAFTSWLWRLKGRRPCPPLPDDIILFEIISRLPLEDVLRWRLVSRKFKELTSTPFFVELHSTRTSTSASSTILVRLTQFYKNPRKFFLIGKDYWQGMIPKKISSSQTYSNRRLLNISSILSKGCNTWVFFTYNGLLVFGGQYLRQQFVICNPITKEKVTLHTDKGWLCGIFQHPYTKDYGVLAVGQGSSGFEFYIRCLVAKTPEDRYWRQLIRNFPYCPFNNHTLKPPVVVHDAIYWICDKWKVGRPASCLESILEFDMISESFTVRPHPPINICSGLPEDHKHMHLLEMDDELALCVLDHNYLPQVKIEIWVLEHYADWSWTKKYTKNLHSGTRNYFDFQIDRLYPVGVFDGELLLHWMARALFAYNLKRGTIRTRKVAFENELRARMFRYSRTLVSLKNFEPEN